MNEDGKVTREEALEVYFKSWKTESIVWMDRKLDRYWEGGKADRLESELSFEDILVSAMAPFYFVKR